MGTNPDLGIPERGWKFGTTRRDGARGDDPAGPSTEADSDTDARWAAYLRRAGSGDEQALAELYDEAGCVVFSLVLRILQDREKAEEVTLEVFTQAWRTAREFDATRGTPLAWLVTLARTRAIDRLHSLGPPRRQEAAPEPLTPDSEAEADPEAGGALVLRRRLVRKALASLPPDHREALELAYFSGLTRRELALRLGLPLATVDVRLRLGFQKLREAFGVRESESDR